MDKRISLNEAIRFHGHLGPYLVLGILAGELALKKIQCNKYFGLEVKIWGAQKKPRSCLIDGLQLSSGATYGKGNIKKIKGKKIKIEFRDMVKRKKLDLSLEKPILEKLNKVKTHRDAELLARQLYKSRGVNLFTLTPRI